MNDTKTYVYKRKIAYISNKNRTYKINNGRELELSFHYYKFEWQNINKIEIVTYKKGCEKKKKKLQK